MDILCKGHSYKLAWGCLFLIVSVLCLMVSISWAEDNYGLSDEIDGLKKENAQLRQKMAEMDAALSDLKQMLGGDIENSKKPFTGVVKQEKSVVTSKWPVELYGYIKLDAAYDTARTDSGNYARWVESEETNEDDDQFNMTARQSRLGLKFKGPEKASVDTSALIEIDFYEGGTENKNRLMMRNAYMKLNWTEYDFSILGGQTSDVISPLFPSTLNYTIGWWAGNIGYRRPQVRLSKGVNFTENSKLLLEAAATRTIGDDWGNDPGDTGEDSGFPTLQGRLAFSFPVLSALKPLTIGISGHWGEEEYDEDAAGSGQNFRTWSTNVDLNFSLFDKITLKGEFWAGENIDAYFGGINQGINQTTLKEVTAIGGWGSLGFGPFDKWSFNIGAGIDDPDIDDLNSADKTRNVNYWGNTLYDINDAASVGVELSYWETDYKNVKDGNDLRLQSSLIYKF